MHGLVRKLSHLRNYNLWCDLLALQLGPLYRFLHDKERFLALPLDDFLEVLLFLKASFLLLTETKLKIGKESATNRQTHLFHLTCKCSSFLWKR